MSAAVELAVTVGIVAACAALAVARATYYRRAAPDPSPPEPRPTPARALAADERAVVLAELNSPRFADLAPREVYARLLDEGRYLCSISTMYRVLAEAGEVRERRDVLRHPSYAKPELVATAPNQVWSWDITKLRGPQKGVYYCLYVVLDLYSRYVVGWMLAPTENGVLAGELIDEACSKQGIAVGALTLHNDRGSPMKARSLAVTLAELGVLHSFSRPQVSDDNPFSEAQFKTLKYMPGFPARFASLDDARAFLRRFFAWYNHEHRHTGLNLHTPGDVHHGRAEAVTTARQLVLDIAHAAHPDRFVRQAPVAALPPAAAWINPPIEVTAAPSLEARA
jgi:transposase InsO family protein